MHRNKNIKKEEKKFNMYAKCMYIYLTYNSYIQNE